MIKTTTIHIEEQRFILHPSGAMFWCDQNILLIADVHLGKITHFRKHGSAVPQPAIHQNFEQLNRVVSYFQPKTLCFLGDLFHSYINSEWLLFSQWSKSIQSTIVLVAGNHDVIAPSAYEKIDIRITDEWLLDTILLTHIPEIREGAFTISGHIHPGIRLKGLGKQSLSIPCFVKKSNQMILPAFGTFTGKYIISPNSEDQVFAVTEDEVIRIE